MKIKVLKKLTQIKQNFSRKRNLHENSSNYRPSLACDPKKLHWDLNTTETFESALAHGLIHENPDLILFTGDLSEDASYESYVRLREAIEKANKPSYLLAGNHDSWEVMGTVFSNTWLPPGYRWLDLQEDGSFNTGARYL